MGDKSALKSDVSGYDITGFLRFFGRVEGRGSGRRGETSPREVKSRRD